MADRYELAFGTMNRHQVKKMQKFILDRVKNLRPRLCKTIRRTTNDEWRFSVYEVRVRVTCSWRTIIELEHYAKNTYFIQEGYPRLADAFHADKLKWTGSRWR